MGYGLTYRLAEGRPADANRWVAKQPEHDILERYGYTVHFWSEIDENDPDTRNYMKHEIGDGYNNLKASLASNADHILEPWARLFEKLHTHESFTVELHSRSCALNNEGYFFTGDQLRRMTNDGRALTGDSAEIEVILDQLKECS